MKNLLLLHGALGTKSDFNDIIYHLRSDFNVRTLSFDGHGEAQHHIPDLSIALFAKGVREFMDSENFSPACFFGYSMGGYVALYIARFFPEYVQGVFTLATKFDWTRESAEKEAALLIPEIIEKKIPAFAKQLSDKHGRQWKILVNKTSKMILEMGSHPPLSAADFRQIGCRVLLSTGDQDKMAGMQETEQFSHYIQNSRVMIWKNTPHSFEKNDMINLAQHIKLFFLNKSE